MSFGSNTPSWFNPMDFQGWSDPEDEFQAASDFGSDDSTPIDTNPRLVPFTPILPHTDDLQ
jgi:hypothetical protein